MSERTMSISRLTFEEERRVIEKLGQLEIPPKLLFYDPWKGDVVEATEANLQEYIDVMEAL